MFVSKKICYRGAFLSLAVKGDSVITRNKYRKNTNKMNLQHKLTKMESDSCWFTQSTPVLPLARQTFPPYFVACFEFFAVFRSYCLFIPLFFRETVTISHRTLFQNTDVGTRALFTRKWNLCHWSCMLFSSVSMYQRVYLFILSHIKA